MGCVRTVPGDNLTGRVLRIEKTSIHDGDGLRTVIFLQGCPLRCLWCSTPESQSAWPQRAYAADRCTRCGSCVAACPEEALRFADNGGAIVVDPEKCRLCFTCVDVCPSKAMKRYGSLMTVEEVMREIAKDEIFYFHSGGGVTFSGGEPLEQIDFVRALLVECRKRGIPCGLESSFFAPWERTESLLSLLDLVYVDLKHIDPAEHVRLTGVDNRVILESIRKASASPHVFDLVLRIPLIPGLNDSDENLRRIAAFASGLKRIRAVEFLAYHRLGRETYRALGRAYPLEAVPIPDPDFMRAKARFFLSHVEGVTVRINGISVRA